jgi:uncharacterized protein
VASQSSRGQFVWHELLAKDTKAEQAFYKQVVGWSTKKWEGPGSAEVDYTMWMAGDRPIGGVMGLPADAKEAGAPPNWTAYVEVPDADETTRQATSLGGTVLMGPHSAEGVGRFTIMKDPQGAVFAFITSATPPEPETDPRALDFSWHELATTDYKAAAKFYETLFGWEKKAEHDMGDMGVYYMFGRGRFTYGGMYDKPKDMPAPPHWVHYVQVDNADAAADRAKKAGGRVVNGPMEVPGGDRIAVILDPEGASFAVHSKAKA